MTKVLKKKEKKKKIDFSRNCKAYVPTGFAS